MICAMLIRALTGVRARWAGEQMPDLRRQSVFFANHTSNLDGPTIWASLPKHVRDRTRPIAAQDYWTRGPVRRFLANNVFRCVLIERNKVSKSCNPLVAMEAALAAGDSLIIFPEGGRKGSEDGELGEFKPGLWHLAKKHPGVAFVPVYLENLNRILPKGDFLWIPLMASATFGEPIAFDPDKTRYMNTAKAAIERMRDRNLDPAREQQHA
jgi:1-acyl-sn-glycerol-3-phosphate acyltransferase